MPEDGQESDDDQSFKSLRSRSPSPGRAPLKTDSEISRPDATNGKSDDHRFTPEEETRLIAESNDLKTSANTLFGKGSFSEAIPVYDRALASVPNYLDYELAVLRSNIAACHIKLSEWKEAIDSATKAADNLERLDPLPQPKPAKDAAADKDANGKPQVRLEQRQEAQVTDLDDDTEAAIARLQQSGHTLLEVQRLRVKILTRRAKARSELGGWSHLQGADEDFRYLLKAPGATETERRNAQGALAALGPRLEDAQGREMAEMMGKLKGLGNSLLKPFGLSTNNFQFVKDENSGGYSMNFQQNPGAGK